MFKVKMQDFRAFGSTSAIEIRPLTFLVGENSAGKTSFLAGLRFLLESFSGPGVNPFNRDPYFLGGFEQIAHYRGGRGGRAKSFSLSLEARARSASGSKKDSDAAARLQSHTFEFGKGDPQPQLNLYTFSTSLGSLHLSLKSSRPEASIQLTGKPAVAIPANELRFPPSSVVRENVSFVNFMLGELTYRWQAVDNSERKDQLEKLGLNVESVATILNDFRHSTSYLDQQVFASAPVRTQPLRTYNPSEVMTTSEGSHVPLELARLKRKSGEGWEDIKRLLESFGSRAGLFTEIDVRQLGRSDIDPFQVQVKANGPAMNLVDVGYGVSQALPIVYQMLNSEMHDVFLLQQPEVHLHPRAQAEMGSLFSQVCASQKQSTMVVETHSDYILDRVKIEIAKGNIPPESVTVVLFQRDQNNTVATNIYFNRQGDLVDPPEGYRSFFMEEYADLLGL